MADIPVEVRRLVCKHLGVTSDELKSRASFIDDLGADSQALVELRLVLEETFDIDIPEEEVEKIRTTWDAIKAVGRQLRARHRR